MFLIYFCGYLRNQDHPSSRFHFPFNNTFGSSLVREAETKSFFQLATLNCLMLEDTFKHIKWMNFLIEEASYDSIGFGLHHQFTSLLFSIPPICVSRRNRMFRKGWCYHDIPSFKITPSKPSYTKSEQFKLNDVYLRAFRGIFSFCGGSFCWWNKFIILPIVVKAPRTMPLELCFSISGRGPGASWAFHPSPRFTGSQLWCVAVNLKRCEFQVEHWQRLQCTLEGVELKKLKEIVINIPPSFSNFDSNLSSWHQN